MGEKYKLAQKTKAIDKTIIRIGDINIGDGSFIVIAGPCAVESQEQIINILQISFHRCKSFASNGVSVLV